MTDWPDRFADRYDVARRLGQGAFARTYLARDISNGRQVALKILDPAQAEDWKTFELFEREAAVLKTLRHQGIPEVFETVRGDWLGRQVHAIALEFIDGQSIGQRIEQGAGHDRAGVMHLFVELLGVLDYLHSRIPSILHRDIKPANIIVRPDGYPVLVDFGAVRSNVVRGDGGSTVAGTYGYMPYEQYMGQATASSDLYALAATFLHLVTGSNPPSFLNPAGRIEVPQALSCGEPLRSVLARMLEPSPSDRFQSAREVKDALFGQPESSGTKSGHPLVGRRAASLAVPASGPPLVLADGPRKIEGDLKTLYHRLAPGFLHTVDPGSARRQGGWGPFAVLAVGFFTVISIGVMPAMIGAVVAARRHRVKPFLKQGLLAEAVILGMEVEMGQLGTRDMRVRYQFEVDGRAVRSSDLVARNRADRWQVGESIQVLYLPERENDSVIASVT
ncbi:MAG: serine/threonine protein kinase [Gemmatimonadales bacterium]